MQSMIRQVIRSMTSAGTRRKLALALVSARRPTALWRPLPNLLIIGAQRCGTSSLFKYLGAHPQCKASVRKEIRFFTEFHDRGVDWYRAHFPIARRQNGSPLVFFEATPDYLLDPRAPRRATELMPDVRVIVLLRDPVKRAYSQYWHNRRLGSEPVPSFEEAVKREPERIGPWIEQVEKRPDQPASKMFLRYSYLERGRYGKHLESWMSAIDDPGRILVLRSEDLFKDTDATFQEILRFLDLPEWRPEKYRNFSYQGERPSYPPMTDECRAWLAEEFAPDTRRLRELLGPKAHLIEDWTCSKV